MYSEYFKLAEPPFSLTPDPHYVFMSQRHREGLAHLSYGIQQPGGFVQLTGEVGSGKTTLCRCLVKQLPPETDAALILNPRLTVLELLASICDDLGVSYPAGTKSVKTLVDALNGYLLEAHAKRRRTVLIIDEAQNLQVDVLEQIRLLTNLETSRDKLLQIVLIGQPELLAVLKRRKLRQLAQRITVRYHLEALSRSETHAYVRHRLSVAGGSRNLFTGPALRSVHRQSGGVPRLINVICDRALLGAYALDRKTVDAGIVRRAARETRGLHRRSRLLHPGWRAGAAALAVLVIGGTVFLTTANLSLLHRSPAKNGPAAEAVGIPASPTASTEGRAEGGNEAGPVLPALGSQEPVVGGSFGADPLQSRAGTAPSAAGAESVPIRPLSTAGSESESLQLVNILADRRLRDTSSASFSSLCSRLGIRIPRDQAATGCRAANDQGYDCLFRVGNWTKLRSYDLPAILELILPTGERQRVLLAGLSGQTAALEIGGREYTFPLAEVDRLWNGSFIIVWKLPFSSAGLAPGVRGERVAWIRRSLDTLEGRSLNPRASDLYDESLRQRIIAFQRDQSLPQDGIAGDMTLVRLTLALMGPDAPSLSHRAR